MFVRFVTIYDKEEEVVITNEEKEMMHAPQEEIQLVAIVGEEDTSYEDQLRDEIVREQMLKELVEPFWMR